MPTEVLPGVYDVTVREDPTGRRYRAYPIDDVPTLFDAGVPDTTDAPSRGRTSEGPRRGTSSPTPPSTPGT